MFKVYLLIFSTVVSTLLFNPTTTFAYDRTIEDGRKVQIDYTLRVDGQVLESTVGKDPLTYTHGESKIIPGLADALLGLKEGDRREIIVPFQQAYGPDEEANYRRVRKTNLPVDVKPQPGMVIEFKGPEGNPLPAIVWEVTQEDILLNFNHPLAGKTLEFDIVVLSIR